MWAAINLGNNPDGSARPQLMLKLETGIWQFHEKARYAAVKSRSEYYGELLADLPKGYDPNLWIVHKWKRASKKKYAQ